MDACIQPQHAAPFRRDAADYSGGQSSMPTRIVHYAFEGGGGGDYIETANTLHCLATQGESERVTVNPLLIRDSRGRTLSPTPSTFSSRKR